MSKKNRTFVHSRTGTRNKRVGRRYGYKGKEPYLRFLGFLKTTQHSQ